MAHTSSDVGVVPGAPPQLGVPPTVVEAAITPTLPMPQDLGTMDLTTIKGFFEVMNKDSPNLTYGGKGPVYKALGIDSGRVYALKIAEWDLDGSEDLHNLSKEFQIHSEFDAKGGHKNVAEFVFGNENNLSLPAEASESWKTTRVLITEYLYGGTLYQIAKNLRPNGMKEEEVKHVLGEIGSGVQFLCAQGVSHRDLSPRNVKSRTTAKNILRMSFVICEFGCADYLSVGASMLQRNIGNVPYAPPENWAPHISARFNDRYDVFSLGAIAVFMIIGETPHWDPVNPTPDFGLLSQKVSVKGVAILKQMLAVNPRGRISIERFMVDSWLVTRQARQAKRGAGFIEAPSSKKLRM